MDEEALLRDKLKTTELKEAAIEMRYSIPDPWARKQTVVMKAPRSFLEGVLWPEFQQIWAELSEFLGQITERVIKEEVFRDTAEAGEIAEPKASLR